MSINRLILPFSVAEESKQYVEEKLPIIETWFIQQYRIESEVKPWHIVN